MAELEMLDETTEQYIVVRLGGEEFGIGIGYVDNIIRMQSITRVPTAQFYFKGVINLRGEVVPVMSIRKKMGLEDDETSDKSRIIILKLEDHELIGVIVAAVSEVVNLANSQIEATRRDSSSVDDSYISGVGKAGQRLISLFDINAVIEDKESA